MTPIFRSGLCGLFLVIAAGAQDASLAGHYEGKLQAPNRELVLSFDLDQTAQKAWIGHITINPGPTELPLANIKLTDATLSFTLAGVPNSPTFEGTWDREAKTIKGEASGGSGSAPFEVTRKGDAKVVVPAPSTALTSDFAGKWEGALDAGGKTLRLVLTLEKGADGLAKGTLISVDQGNQSIPVSTVTINGSELKFTVKVVDGGYSGKLNEAKDEITGDWTQMGNSLPLTLKKATPAQ